MLSTFADLAILRRSPSTSLAQPREPLVPFSLCVSPGSRHSQTAKTIQRTTPVRQPVGGCAVSYVVSYLVIQLWAEPVPSSSKLWRTSYSGHGVHYFFRSPYSVHRVPNDDV